MPLVAICFAGCDDAPILDEDGALKDLSVETAEDPRIPDSRAPLSAPAHSADFAAISDDPDASDYVIVGPDDVDGFGWQFGFGVGERVPKDTLRAQRAAVDRMHELYEEWRESGQHPQDFVRLHSDELRRLSYGFPGMEAASPMRARRSGSPSTRPPAGTLTTPPPPVVGVFDASLHPCDRPAHALTPNVNCSAAKSAMLSDARDNAEYMVWRSLQLLDRIAEEKGTPQAELHWRDGWPGNYIATSHQLQNWFGNYDPERADDIRGAYQTLWNRWLGPAADGVYEDYIGVQHESGFECYITPQWWQWGLWIKYALTFNPCLLGTAPAHHFYGSGPQFCDSFFAGSNDEWNRFRNSTIVHELLHKVRINSVLIKDTHIAWCSIDDGDAGLAKCYEENEVLALARDAPHVARINNENYAQYSQHYQTYWNDGSCMDPDVCAEVDDGQPGCEPPPPPPPPPEYPECEDLNNPNQLGTPGCPCKDVGIFQFNDIALDGGAPDGEGSYLAGANGQFCLGPDVVCSVIFGADPNSSADDHPLCRDCGDDSDDTKIGCPCQTDLDCGGLEPGLVCWGSGDSDWASSAGGKCLPDSTVPNQEWHEEHRWFCLDNCESLALGQQDFGCYFDQDPGGLGVAEHGECITMSNACAGLLDGQCELDNNQECTVDDECVDECNFNEDCALRGFPGWYECDSASDLGFEPGHCVPPGCSNTNSTFCGLFR